MKGSAPWVSEWVIYKKRFQTNLILLRNYPLCLLLYMKINPATNKYLKADWSLSRTYGIYHDFSLELLHF
jgi:hypothetical protein